jgi:CHASE2 domain-containing sensor protein
MNGAFGISLVVGIVGLIAWILVGGFSEANDGRPKHPDERFGAPGRAVVAALTAFGIGGLSASFGGWPTAASVIAALAAAGVFGVYAYRFDPGADPESD